MTMHFGDTLSEVGGKLESTYASGTLTPHMYTPTLPRILRALITHK